jgi:iron complex outermembrane recepter protein
MRSKNDQALFRGNPVRIAVVTALLAWHALGTAAEPAPAARYQVDQPSQPLSESLRAIAKQTSSSVLFDPAAVSGRVSRPVSGQLSGAEAISRALEGTGLNSEVMKDGAIVVKPKGAPAAAPAAARTSTLSAAEPRAAVLLAQATGGTDSDVKTPASVVATATTDGRVGQAAATQRIEVTGSRIKKKVETETALPVNVYTKADIERSGQPTLSGFLNGLSEVSLSSTSEGTLGGVFPGSSTVQLRGLPVGTTLVLLNGRRLQDSGLSALASVFNLNLIPLAAVERVEIVPTGSSAVYGGDALAGVVNIILKKSIEGFSLESRYGTASGTEDGGLSLATGGVFERGSFLLVGALSKKTPLNAGERELFRDADYRRFGGSDTRVLACTPGTVSSTTTASLPGLDSPVAGIPSVAPGQALTIADFTATSGQPNLCSLRAAGYGTALIYGEETTGVHAAVDYNIGGTWSAFAELTYSKTSQVGREQGFALSDVLVPASNPFNPFGVDVLVTSRLGPQNGTIGFGLDTKFHRALLGIRGQVTSGWEIEATVARAAEDNDARSFNFTEDFAAQAAALAASDPAGALNPFTSGRAASDQVLRGIWSSTLTKARGSRDLFNGFVRGSVADLPAGSVDVIAGVEVGRDKWVSGAAFDLRRQTESFFAEARVPLLSSSSNQASKSELAALTLAGRHDRYNDIGSANTYQVGLEVRPSRTLLLRATTATSFKPPTLFQQSPIPQAVPAEFFGLTDPLRGNAPLTTGEVIFNAQNALEPEEGKAKTLGVVWGPDRLPGLQASVAVWRIGLTNKIIQPGSPQFFLDNEALFPGLVERAPTVGGVIGEVTRVKYASVNFGNIDVAGVDIGLSYSFPTPVGKWSLSGNATRTGKYDVVLVPNAPKEDRVGQRSSEAWAPEWKGQLAVGFERGPWNIGVTGRYLGSYKDAGANPRDLGGIWYVDLSASADLKQLLTMGSTFKSARFTAGVVNAGNKLPEFVNAAPYYDTTQGDWRGRYLSARLSVAW